MQLHDVFYDREAETGAAKLARARAIDAIEAFGQARDVGGRNPFAGVGTTNSPPRARLRLRGPLAARGAGARPSR